MHQPRADDEADEDTDEREVTDEVMQVVIDDYDILLIQLDILNTLLDDDEVRDILKVVDVADDEMVRLMGVMQPALLLAEADEVEGIVIGVNCHLLELDDYSQQHTLQNVDIIYLDEIVVGYVTEYVITASLHLEL